MKTRYNLADSCFYIFWFLLQLGKGLGYTSQNEEYKLLLVCAIPFALIRMVFLKWDLKSLLKCVALNMLGVATMLVSKSTTYLLSMFCITAVRGMDIKKVLKTTLIVRGPLFVIRTALAVLGFTDMEIAYRYSGGMITTVRYALGYGNPNTTQFELFMLVILFFYLYRERVSFLLCLITFAYNLFIFRYTDSKTAYYLIGPFLIAAYICMMRDARPIVKLATAVSTRSWIIGILFTLLGCYIYMNITAFRLLGTFSSRFLTASRVIRNFGVSLLGNEGVRTDLGYIHLVYDGGIILAVLFFVGVNKLLMTKFVRSNVILCLAFACLSIFNIMESYTYSVLSNPLLLYLSYVVYPSLRTYDNGQPPLSSNMIQHNTQ